MSNKTKKLAEEKERKIILDLTRSSNQSEPDLLQNRIDLKTPLPPVIKKGAQRMLPKEDKHTRKMNQMITNTKSLQAIMMGSNLKKSIQASEKLVIDCQEADTLNTSIKSQRSNREIKLFHLLNDDNDSNDDTQNAFNQIAQHQKEHQFFQLDSFLKAIHLSNLFQLFIKNKVTDSLSINTLTENKLIAMRITKENRKKILNRIHEINQPSSSNNEMGVQSNSNDKDDGILDFEENERIQAELFKKAVEEFRRGGKDNDPPKEVEEEERSNADYNNNQQPKVDNPKRFLMNLGGRDLFNLNEVSLFQDEGNDIKDDAEYLAELAIGRACWNCLKKIYDAYPKKIDEKYFCSGDCCGMYQRENAVKCSFCNKSYYKNNGLYHKQYKFCSIDCFDKDRNTIIEHQNEEEDNDNDDNNHHAVIKHGMQSQYNKEINNDFDILDI